MSKKTVGMGGCHSNKEEVFQAAWDRGVRFFDSGYGYSGVGVNDEALGNFLADKKREEVTICNKLPLFDKLYQESFGKSRFDMTNSELEFAIRKILEKQLERCKTTYFDIYMFHAIFDEKFQKGFDIVKWLGEYIRIGEVLLKLKDEGLIKKIGFSSHNNFTNLYFFVEEMEKIFGKDFLEVAEVSYNILNSEGCDQSHKPKLAELYNITVWDAAGLKGLKYLKNKGMQIVDMMPTESGRIQILSTAPDFFDWALRFIRETEEVDIVLAGTSSLKHLNQFIDIFDEVDLKNIPDMRVIESGVSHCHE